MPSKRANSADSGCPANDVCPVYVSLQEAYLGRAADAQSDPRLYYQAIRTALHEAPECSDPDGAMNCPFRCRALELADRIKKTPQPNSRGFGTELNRLFERCGLPEMEL